MATNYPYDEPIGPAAVPDGRPNLLELSVSELSFALKRTLEENFAYVRVRGEISGFKGAHCSGHCYFALKDERALLDAVCWRTYFDRARHQARGGAWRWSSPAGSPPSRPVEYQIIIEPSSLPGRRADGAARGAAPQARRRGSVRRRRVSSRCPFCRAVIGVITSPTGAVIRDILHRSATVSRAAYCLAGRGTGRSFGRPGRRRHQGFNAPAAGRRYPAAGRDHRRPRRRHVEDLWGFNEEVVVRAAAACADPADFGRRPRDRHDADRLCVRPPRPDPDRRGRTGGTRSWRS